MSAGTAPVSLILVAALGENGVIGRAGGLPWRLKSDLRQFRALTIGKPVVMGRKTFLSLSGPLKGRTNIVVSRDVRFAGRGVLAAPSIETALACACADAWRRGVESVAIIGGTEIFAQTIVRADRLVLTHVRLSPPGDTFFPSIDPGRWREVERHEYAPGPEDDAGFTVVTYARR